MDRMAGKVALVPGSAKGIDLAVARRLRSIVHSHRSGGSFTSCRAVLRLQERRGRNFRRG